jgi:hypothetical protein
MPIEIFTISSLAKDNWLTNTNKQKNNDFWGIILSVLSILG